MTIRLIAAATVFIAGASMVTPGVAAQAAPDYVRTAYDGTIYEVTDDDVVPLTFAEWSDRKFPAYTSAPTVFQKVLSFPTVSAVTTFARADVVQTEDISWPEYQQAGYPSIRSVRWGEGISVHKWGTSTQLLAQDAAGDVIALTYPQWRDAGFPSFEAREGRGFVRLSWDATGGIAYLCDTSTGHGGRLTYDQWRSLGFPTPYTVSRTANDNVWRIFRGAQLSYVGAMNLTYNPGGGLQPGLSNRAISFAEWQAMGSPAPVDRIPDSSADLRCADGAPTAWD